MGICASHDTRVIHVEGKIHSPSIGQLSLRSARIGSKGSDRLTVEDVTDMDILDVNTIPAKEPLAFFEHWFEEAQYCNGVRLATSMTLATASRDGRPSCRIVGVKGFDKAGFKIATNRHSRKAIDLDENPYASLMFYWEPINRMVRIDGPVVKLTEEGACDIWRGFPRAAKLTHGASSQGEVIASREVILKRRNEMQKKYPELMDVPKNIDWCAYNLVPEWWEFYQVSPDLPDRVVFRRPAPGEGPPDGVTLHQGKEGWVYERLAP